MNLRTKKKSVFKNIRVTVEEASYLICLFVFFFYRITFFENGMIYDKKRY